MNTDDRDTILAILLTDSSSWQQLVAFAPRTSDAATDANLRNRYMALLALHVRHQSADKAEDLRLVMYLLDQEVLYHRQADHYRSSISLACYLLARYRQPSHLWAIWAAREANFDALKSVDSHYMWYATSGVENAKMYLERCGMGDVGEGAAEDGGRVRWWRELVEDAGDEAKAFEELKRQVVERIKMDVTCGITDETVEKFVDDSWRSETKRWEESLLP
ncbi:uncharacterized protein STEHIDRAFT_156266 [Stereum hirsutum FP-91666 SS1]|uniref:uncharacterized protein n=1 Tax=Stereum hirsutum (strain FP-91666) TaxID=721885 RepID=UPI000440B770|nr:uncharacterized protein STEHIDRAFT_156266 [Stereum hirsutum FP-91666 SS1]EIM87282.1 hypothetical protein STEHIDRAFT_156266 [Stereum hirsutum FP-91666 SS1]